MRPETSDRVLNAFIDGELSPAEVARISVVIADDPTLAQRVAHLHQIKAAVSAMPDDLVLPAPPMPRQDKKGKFRWVRALIAGCALLLAVFWSAPVTGPAYQDTASPFIGQHDHWVSQGAERDGVVLPESFDWLRPLMHASGLKLVHYSQEGNLQHFGFKGVNACRLSLFVSSEAAAVSPFQLSLTEQVQHAQWYIGTLAFDMIARDMAPVRFATVATALYHGSQDHAADEALQIAFLQAARLPCTA